MSYSGFLNLVKPPGMTSHDVVSFVRRQLPRGTKVGHLGTLDPDAAGVLPLAIGKATKLIPWLPNLGPRMKSYLGHIQLGVTTVTDDLDGPVTERAAPDRLAALEIGTIEAEIALFRGKIKQVPPQVSAIRQDGKRAYERVRKGQTVELRARDVEIETLQILDFCPQHQRLQVFMVCASGTYVRSLARDLGQRLGVGGALAFLLRTQSGPFVLSEASSLEEFLRFGIRELLQPCSYPFTNLPYFSGQPLLQRGQTLAGDFLPNQLYLACNGLLRGKESEPGVGAVEVLFEGDVSWG